MHDIYKMYKLSRQSQLIFVTMVSLSLGARQEAGVSHVFLKSELEQELRETPHMLKTFRFKSDSDFEKYMDVESKHCVYPHEQQQSCIAKGNNFFFQYIMLVGHFTT